MIHEKDMPKEVGYYWARGSGFKWWNLIINIYGEFPYLRYRIWDIVNDRIVLDKDRYSVLIEEIGMKIPKPE